MPQATSSILPPIVHLVSSSVAKIGIAIFAALMLTVLFTATPADAAASSTSVEHGVAAPTANTTYYVVQPGDTLSSIARRYGTTVAALANANHLVNPNHIYVGQRLVIVASSSSGPAISWPVNSTHYVVKAGDSLSEIARQFNTTVQAIAAVNGITNTSYVYVGQRLVVPSGSAYPPSVYGFYYTVKGGDTLSSIAQWYGINLHTLASVNGISNISRIYVGQRLYIP